MKIKIIHDQISPICRNRYDLRQSWNVISLIIHTRLRKTKKWIKDHKYKLRRSETIYWRNELEIWVQQRIYPQLIAVNRIKYWPYEVFWRSQKLSKSTRTITKILPRKAKKHCPLNRKNFNISKRFYNCQNIKYL